jgi:hypothetical protein
MWQLGVGGSAATIVITISSKHGCGGNCKMSNQLQLRKGSSPQQRRIDCCAPHLQPVSFTCKRWIKKMLVGVHQAQVERHPGKVCSATTVIVYGVLGFQNKLLSQSCSFPKMPGDRGRDLEGVNLATSYSSIPDMQYFEEGIAM